MQTDIYHSDGFVMQKVFLKIRQYSRKQWQCGCQGCSYSWQHWAVLPGKFTGPMVLALLSSNFTYMIGSTGFGGSWKENKPFCDIYPALLTVPQQRASFFNNYVFTRYHYSDWSSYNPGGCADSLLAFSLCRSVLCSCQMCFSVNTPGFVCKKRGIRRNLPLSGYC